MLLDLILCEIQRSCLSQDQRDLNWSPYILKEESSIKVHTFVKLDLYIGNTKR